MKTETGLVRGHWTTEGFSISMSIDSSTDNFGPEVNGTLQVQDTALQEVPVGMPIAA